MRTRLVGRPERPVIAHVVDVGPVGEAHYPDPGAGRQDWVDDPVLAPARRPVAPESEPQRLAHAVGIPGERAAEEVDDGDGSCG